MNDAWEFLRQGGPVMIPLLVLSLVLYERCIHLLLYLLLVARRLEKDVKSWTGSLRHLRQIRAEVEGRFSRESEVIRAMVAAAPLVGLLGTVMGMVRTFDTMAMAATAETSEGFAQGISMALITTETGLAIAIPAVIAVYYAQRQLRRVLQAFTRLENTISVED